MLALYDLCAVLSPCGPLKALVNELSKKDAPSMPGLLYEAELPSNATRPGQKKRQRRARDNNVTTAETESGDSNENTDVEENRQQLPDVDNNSAESIDADCSDAVQCDAEKTVELTALHREESSMETSPISALVIPTTDASILPEEATTSATKKSTTKARKKKREKSDRKNNPNNLQLQSEPENRSEKGYSVVTVASQEDNPAITVVTVASREDNLAITVPLAIARVYKLPISLSNTYTNMTSIDTSNPKAYLQQELSQSELRTNVDVTFPRRGGRIEVSRNKQKELRYLVYNRDGELKRTLLVDEEGKVMEEKQRLVDEKGSNNIKLGLGDFIFYSVLVSKAAENGFAPFLACFLAILTGLGATLVLLAVYHHALPALPISIFLAVVFFVLTIYCIEPW